MTTEYIPPSIISVEGATAPSGKPYVRVEASQTVAWIPRDGFTGSGGHALRMLSAAGIPLLSDEWAKCKKLVAQLASYPATPLLDRIGRTGEYFALPDGKVFSPSRKDKPVVLFPKNPQKCAAAGFITRWRDLTALLSDQPIATFVLLIGYVGPFLSFTRQVMNQGF